MLSDRQGPNWLCGGRPGEMFAGRQRLCASFCPLCCHSSASLAMPLLAVTSSRQLHVKTVRAALQHYHEKRGPWKRKRSVIIEWHSNFVVHRASKTSVCPRASWWPLTERLRRASEGSCWKRRRCFIYGLTTAKYRLTPC